MVIWLVTVGEPLPIVEGDTPRLLRTGVLVQRLAQRGHDVTWWTSTFDHYAKRHHFTVDTSCSWGNARIRLLHSVGYRRNVSFRRFIEHREVAKKFAREARMAGTPDLILCSWPTIELSCAAVAYGLERNIPVLLDIRDLWPDALIDLAPRKLRWLSRLLFSASLRNAAWALRNATGLIGISNGYLDWALKHAGRTRRATDGMYPLGYVAPPEDRADSLLAADKLRALGIDDSRTLIWYIGSFGRQYDLAPVLEGAKALRGSDRNAQFVISGDGELGARWHSMAKGLENVVFTGWINVDEIHWLRRRAAIGLQPYVRGAPQGLANKLFEYLSAGIPVLSSLAGENAELIKAHSCGQSYEAGNTGDFLAKLSYLLSHTDETAAMGRRGRALFERQYNGEIVYDGLIHHLEKTAHRQ